MKFDEDILKQLNLEQVSVREPVNVMKISDALQFLKACAERIHLKSEVYLNTNDNELKIDCLDIVTIKINDFTQVFKDLMIFMRKNEDTHKGANNSLRYCISSFDTFDFQRTSEEEWFLNELLLRNEITHDYFNRELHQQKLIWIMEHCSSGAFDVYKNLNQYCVDNQLMDQVIRKNN